MSGEKVKFHNGDDYVDGLNKDEFVSIFGMTLVRVVVFEGVGDGDANAGIFLKADQARKFAAQLVAAANVVEYNAAAEEGV